MVGIALREFECSLCQQRFTLGEGDLILPVPRICDDCLKAVWVLDEDDLIKHIAEFKEIKASELEDETKFRREREFENKLIKYIQFHREQWSSADEAVRSRERDRQVFGKAKL